MINYRDAIQLSNFAEENHSVMVSIRHFDDVVKLLRDCRNELCKKCGEYKMCSDISSCKNCRWRDE